MTVDKANELRAQGKRIETYVDGKLIPACYLSNERENIALSWPVRENGERIADIDGSGNPKLIYHIGRVEVRVVDEV